MADMIRGLMLGFAAGAAVGILSAIVTAVFLMEYPIAEIILSAILFGFFGALLGVIYAGFYERLPGKDAINKGIIVGVSFILIIDLFLMALMLVLGMGIEIMNFVLDILAGALYGFLLGKLWSLNFIK